ncbi:MAG: 60 kDa chaperonin 5 [Chlamydiales bacterium]|nr:60 kDa chaperonin 5 [Chlamydiales bacterium]
MTDAKEIIFEHEAREKLSRGISKLVDAVRSTLGPKGRNVGLEKSWGAPTITNDGNSIVRDIELADQFENMGVTMAQEVASKLKDKCGDGTTTAALLLESLVQHGVKFIAAGSSPISIKRGVETAIAAVVKELETQAISIKSPEEIRSIAAVSASGSQEIGQLIADALEKVGKEGVVTIEEAKSTDTSIELVEGMQFDRGYISPYFSTNQEKMTVEMENPYILLIDKKVASIQELLPILQAVSSTGRELLVVAEDIEADALATLVVNKLRGSLKICAVKAPGFGDSRKAMLEDLAILSGATVVSEEAGIYLKDATTEVLGSCERCEISKDNTTLVGGSGSHEAIKGRAEQLQGEADASTSSYDKEKLLERRAKLVGGVAVIRVGAATEPELKQKKQAFEDSLSSTRAALEEGVVPGGGVALLKASVALDKMQVEGDAALGRELVRKMVEAPARQIIKNAGHDSSIIVSEIRAKKEAIGFNVLTEEVEDLFKAGVIDPLKVVKNALVHAASCGSMVLISEALIGDAEQDTE